MRQNRIPMIDGDGRITERSKEILEFLGGNCRGTSKDESLKVRRIRFEKKSGDVALKVSYLPGPSTFCKGVLTSAEKREARSQEICSLTRHARREALRAWLT